MKQLVRSAIGLAMSIAASTSFSQGYTGVGAIMAPRAPAYVRPQAPSYVTPNPMAQYMRPAPAPIYPNTSLQRMPAPQYSSYNPTNGWMYRTLAPYESSINRASQRVPVPIVACGVAGISAAQLGPLASGVSCVGGAYLAYQGQK